MVCGTAAGPGLPTVVGPTALLFPGGAALARVPGRGRAALGGRVSGGISLPGPAFPFGLPAAFPVGLFLPAPFLPLPGLPFLLPAAGQFFLASGFPFLALPALSLLPLAAGFLFLSAADLGLALALLPFGLPALAFLGLPGLPLCPELAVSLLPLQSLLLPLDLPFLGFLGPLGLSLLGLLLAAEQLFLALLLPGLFFQFGLGLILLPGLGLPLSCWRSCRLARRSSLVRSWNRRTSPTTTRTKAISSSSRT